MALSKTIRKKKDWVTFYKKWGKCTNCDLHKNAIHHVIYEQDALSLSNGNIPPPLASRFIDVLFIGEAPGTSENLIGRPFIGASGQVLRKMIEDSQSGKDGFIYSYGITNVVACIPFECVETDKTRKPTDEEAEACAPRVKEIIKFTDPELVILLGKIAQNHFEKYIKSNTCCVCETMFHPSFTLHNGGIGSSIYDRQLEIFRRILRTTFFPQGV